MSWKYVHSTQKLLAMIKRMYKNEVNFKIPCYQSILSSNSILQPIKIIYVIVNPSSITDK